MFETRIFLKETDSTMEFAKKIAGIVYPPFVVVSEIQTGGYGQYGRRWESPSGGLWFTEVFYAENSEALSLFLSLPIIRVLESLCFANVHVKWPNDIYLNGKKLAGILTKISGKTVFAGIGINVENEVPNVLTGIATTLKGNIEIGKTELLNKILKTQEEMFSEYVSSGFSPFVCEYNNHLIFLNKLVRVKAREEIISGTALGVNGEGNLIIKTGSDVIKVRTGTIIDF